MENLKLDQRFEKMVSKEIKLLKKQIEKLTISDFDLEAWKDSTASVLARIFGSNDLKVKQIQGFKIDYGSWALRDAKASYNPLESCKKRGKEILEMAISELEAFGVPPISNASAQVITALENALTVSQLNNLREIIKANEDPETKRKLLTTKLKALKTDMLADILAETLINIDVPD